MRLVVKSLPIAAAVCTLIVGCVAPHDERWRIYNDNGVQAYAAGDYREALESFNLAITHCPQDAVLFYNAGECYDRLGNIKKAEEYYTQCIQLDAKNGDARLALYTLYYRTKRDGLANQRIQEWLQQEPRAAGAYALDAWRLRQEKNYPQAQTRVQQALSIDPYNRLALTEQAVLYEAEGMPDKAFVEYERVLEQDKNQTEIAGRLEQLKAKGVSRPVPDQASKEPTAPLALP